MEKKEDLLVSVVITTYNQAYTLRDRAIKSILGQTYKNIEVIVVDDHSPDNTEEVVREVMKTDPRLHYTKTAQRNYRPTPGRNQGTRASKGEFICGIDHDDMWAPTFIEETVHALQELPPEYGAATTPMVMVDEYGRMFYDRQPIETYWGLSIGCGYMFRRDVFFKSNVWFDDALLTYDDVDFSITFAEKGYKIYMLEKPLRVYYLPPIKPRKGGLFLSDPTMRTAKSFSTFYDKAFSSYEKAGRDALAWLYISGGITLARGGMMKEGRRFLWKAFWTKPSPYRLFYALLSLGNHRIFEGGFRLKSRIMRMLHANVLNPLPEGTDTSWIVPPKKAA